MAARHQRVERGDTHCHADLTLRTAGRSALRRSDWQERHGLLPGRPCVRGGCGDHALAHLDGADGRFADHYQTAGVPDRQRGRRRYLHRSCKRCHATVLSVARGLVARRHPRRDKRYAGADQRAARSRRQLSGRRQQLRRVRHERHRRPDCGRATDHCGRWLRRDEGVFHF